MIQKGFFISGLFLLLIFSSCEGQENKVRSDIKPDPFDVALPVFPEKDYLITDFGAVPSLDKLNTQAINDAIIRCSEDGGGRVIIPGGLWLTGPIRLRSHVNLHTEAGAVVLFTDDFSQYPYIHTWFEGRRDYRAMPPLYGDSLEHVAITGEGVFDGSGDAWRFVKKDKTTEAQWKKLLASGGFVSEDGRQWWPDEYAYKVSRDPDHYREILDELPDKDKYKVFYRPALLQLIACDRVLLDGPTFQNSPGWCIHPLMCTNLSVRGITVKNPWYAQNGDGIDVESCSYVSIKDSQFDVGDDAVCIKSGKDQEGRDRGMPTQFVVVDRCVVQRGHGGFVVGSEMSGGVKDIWVSNCSFIGTDVGLRFKSRRGRGGVVENIHIDNIRMVNIDRDAIIFNLFYANQAPTERSEYSLDELVSDAPEVSEETPAFRNISISGIQCQHADRALNVLGLPEMPVSGLKLSNSFFVTRQGIHCLFARDVTMDNVQVLTEDQPTMLLTHVRDAAISDIAGNDAKLAVVAGSGSSGISIRSSGAGSVNTEVEIAAGVAEGAVFIDK